MCEERKSCIRASRRKRPWYHPPLRGRSPLSYLVAAPSPIAGADSVAVAGGVGVCVATHGTCRVVVRVAGAVACCCVGARANACRVAVGVAVGVARSSVDGVTTGRGVPGAVSSAPLVAGVLVAGVLVATNDGTVPTSTGSRSRSRLRGTSELHGRRLRRKVGQGGRQPEDGVDGSKVLLRFGASCILVCLDCCWERGLVAGHLLVDILKLFLRVDVGGGVDVGLGVGLLDREAT